MNEIELVNDLVNRRKEGDFWDFKRIHHSNTVDLVKDIICLANADTKNDRYIIFGVDNSYNYTGITGTENRRTQSDIICILRDSNFSREIYPDIYLHYIDDLDVDLLIIKNRPEKPYYIEREKRDRDKRIIQGVIYTRSRDSNTPTNRTASYEQISSMWKEQFGLLNSPVERMENLLLDSSNWECDFGNKEIGYNKSFPEYNFKIIAKGTIDSELKKFFINPTVFLNTIEFRYHTTVLFEIDYLGVDEYRELYPAPDINSTNRTNFYVSFCRKSKKGTLLKFFMNRNLNRYNRVNLVEPFIFFEDEHEKNEFEHFLEEQSEESNEIQIPDDIKRSDDTTVEVLAEYYYRSFIIYKKWKGI